MKKVIIVLSWFLCLSTVTAQSDFNYKILAPDTAKSVFADTRFVFLATTKIPIDKETFFPLYVVKVCYDSTYPTVKFPGSNWIMIRSSKDFPNATPPCGHGINESGGTGHLCLTPIYDEYPELFDLATNGVTIQVRYQMYISINGGPYHFVYSNIETMWLPPAHSDDISAMAYLKSNFKDIRGFAYLRSSGVPSEKYYQMKQQYPNSLLGEIAGFRALGYEYVNKRYLEGESPSLKEWCRSKWSEFLTTKSDYLHDVVQEQLNMLQKM